MRARRSAVFFARVVGLAAVGLALASGAGAQKPAEKKPAAAAAIDVKPIVAKLKSGDENQLKEALDEVRMAGPGGAAAAPAIAEALTRGLTLTLTQSAIETLGDL